jgi:transglutaminase-like putative cysteine protease
MSTKERLTVASACAVALASAALVPVFDGLGWLLRVLAAIAVVAGCSALARRAGLPRLLEPLAGLVGLGLYVCLVFAGPTLAFGLLPGGQTLRSLSDTVESGLLDVAELAPPVPSRQGLVLLAVLGVGAIAVVVDLLAVTLRQAAIAGLPLLLLFAVPAAVLPGGLGWWPFALGAAGWLGLLLADGSDVVSRWGTPLHSPARARVAPDPSLGRVGRRIGAAALGVAVVVPALVPGLDGRLLGGGTGGGGFGGSRTTTTYNPILELGGQLRQPEPGRLLMRYETADPAPDYLRLTTLDLFDEDRGWSSSELSADLQDDAVQDGIPSPLNASQVQTDLVETSIDVGRIDGPWLPTTFPPTDVEIDGPWLWDEESQTVFSTRTSLREVDEPYVVQSTRIRPTAELLRASAGVPSEISRTYAVVPELSPYVQQLLDETVAGEETGYDKVAAIQALFRDASNGFIYSENASVPGFDQPDALERFLRGKQGFCEQYASAMAALVRGLGIPARVAVGFTPGSRRGDGVYEVTTSDAHAWPEVWFSGAGWVRFEPTPRDVQVTTPGYTQPPAEAPVSEEPASASAAPQAPASEAPVNPRAEDREDFDTSTAAGSDDGLSDRALAALAGGTGLLVLLTLPSALAALRRRRRWASPTALSAWGQVCDDGVDVGHEWRAADSPRAAAAHLAAARGLPQDAVSSLDRLAVAAERARYARPDSVGTLDGAALHEDARTVRSALLAGAGSRQRWLARLAPLSTLRWASHGLGSAMADVLDRFDTLVSAAGDRLRHPRAPRAPRARRPAA